MDKLNRGLKSGASLAALSLGGIAGLGVMSEANAALPLVINTPVTAAVTVQNTQIFSYVSVTGALGDVQGDLTNNGVVGVGLNGAGIAINGTVEGSVINNALVLGTTAGIYVGSGATVSSDVVNNGHIVVVNTALPFGFQEAGIWDNGGVSGNIVNNGTITVAGQGTTTASVYGILSQNNDHSNVTNSGNIYVYGNGNNGTNINYYAISQDVSNAAGSANVSFDNQTGALVDLDVGAFDGEAFINTGIYQFAYASTDAASVSLSNEGEIDILAHAKGSGTGYVQAQGYIDTGIYQKASGQSSGVATTIASADLTNSNTGAIHVSATAKVTATVTAVAYATISNGIRQIADVNTATGVSGGEAHVTLTNNGEIQIYAGASAATGSFADAYANIYSGVSQHANNGDYSSVKLVNNSDASLVIEANAYANGLNTAYANAYIATGISQHANAGGGLGATASLTNNGEIYIGALAHADGGIVGSAEATARANIGDGILQVAQDGNSSYAGLYNDGPLTVIASARAHDAGGHAEAFAAITVSGIYQSATGVNRAQATLTNDSLGTLTIEPYASATGKTADATARFGRFSTAANGIFENVSAGSYGTAKLINDGTMNIYALASAKASGAAFASASFYGSAIYQNNDLSTGISVNDTVQNNGIMDFGAFAVADGVTKATASAYVYDGIDQYALDGVAAKALLSNADSLNIGANARAYAHNGNAKAVATEDYAIYQDVSATTPTGTSRSSALAEITNSNEGVLEIGAFAKATAIGGKATAEAYISSGGAVDQYAKYAQTATALLTNDPGSQFLIDAHATAHAGLTAYASASVDYGIYQYVYATGGGASSLAQIDNGGLLDIAAQATAIGSKATASAYAYYPVYQYAYGGLATVDLTNSGEFDIFALAKATATNGNAAAFAEIQTGIAQYAYGKTAQVGLVNSSSATFNIVAQATAKAIAHTNDNATATASIGSTGIYQYAQGQDASADLTNEGAMTIGVYASAKGGHSAYAWAGTTASTDGNVIEQDVSASGTGTATLTNDTNGTLSIIASAKAIAPNQASAIASFSSEALDQDVYNGSSDTASIVNDGMMVVGAFATASADGYALAEAYNAYPIQQEIGATGVSSLASASITNNKDLGIEALANAHASGTAFASATIYDGIWQSAYGNNSASSVANVDLNNTNGATLLIAAQAKANGYTTGTATTVTYYPNYATATASINQGIHQSASDAIYAHDTLTNSGDINIEVAATASANYTAVANAGIHTGVYQHASNAYSATNLFANYSSGTVHVGASAHASATGSALAAAFVNNGIYQKANGATFAGNHFYNDGTIVIQANASATDATAIALVGGTTHLSATSGCGAPGASPSAEICLNTTHNLAHTNSASFALVPFVTSATGAGIHQYAASAFAAYNDFNNDGEILIGADATAYGFGAAASALAIGIVQTAYNAAYATDWVTNNAYIDVHATAHAYGFIAASAAAFAIGVVQSASDANYADADLSNYGTLDVAASAYASAATAKAGATAVGIQQTAHRASYYADADLYNNGTIDVGAFASASASGGGAGAKAVGAIQAVSSVFSSAGTMSVDFNNTYDGVFNVHATANASASTGAAFAMADGVFQDLPDGGSEHFTNAGYFHVEASANDYVSTGFASAEAVGLVANIENGGSVDIENYASGEMHVSAHAYGFTGKASAAGIVAIDTTAGDTLTGFIDNDGLMDVEASGPNTANAAGIIVSADEFTGLIENEGNLQVKAIASGVTNMNAVGIMLTSNSAPTGLGTATIENDGGTMWVGVSRDGVTFTRGDAIYTINAPNAVNINLNGDGSIYGDIEMSADDVVTVANGHTKFDGVINDPNWVGSLTITANGTLELANGTQQYNPSEDAAHGFVNNFDQEGTLQLDINPNPRAASDYAPATSTAGFISANTANVAGPVVLRPEIGLYGDSTRYQVVFSESAPITGTWSSITTTWNSVLLQPRADYQTYEYDIYLDRVAFDAVTGLTPNEKSVGGGLEGGYSTSLTGDVALLYESLFMLTADQYPKVLDMLSGEEAGTLALANLSASKVLLDAVNEHLNLGSVSGGMASLPQPVNRAQGGTSDTEVWGGLFGSWTNGDDTISGPGWDGTEKGVMAGVDTMVDRNAKLGVAASYTSDGKLDFNPYGKPVGNHGSFDGFQIAGYGHYDADDGYYLQGFASYGTFNNDTRRWVSLPLLGPAIVRGSYTSDVWSLYGEGGMKWSTDGDVNVTPYIGLGYMQSSSGSYTERGLGGANLAVSDAKATSFASYIGVKLDFGTQMGEGKLVPTLRAAWRHEFDDNIWQVNASFAGIAGSGFSIDGSALSQDSADVSAGLGYMFDNDISAMLDYEGNFSSDHSTNTIMGRVKVKL